MSKSNIQQNVLMGLIALILLGTLWFLYDKTQSVDLREQKEVVELLNEVRDIDNRWDIQAQRLRVDLSEPTLLLMHTESGDKALRDITQFAGLTSSKVLRTGLPELRSAIQRKAELMQLYVQENSANRQALKAILKASAELKTRKLTPATTQALAQLAETAPQFFLHGEVQQRATLQGVLAQMGGASADNEQASIVAALQTLLEQVPREIGHYDELMRLSSGPRLINLTLSFNRELDDVFQVKEQFRIYLVYYASALVILLIYLGVRLRIANQTLEQRVEVRTRELSDALQHLKESEAQLIQSEKMSSLGQMVAGVAHEINTPLAYVKNSLGKVSEQLPLIGNALDHSEKLLEQLRLGNDAEGLAREFQHTTNHIGVLRQQHVIEELSALVKDGLFGTGQVAEIVGNLKNFSRLDRSKVANTNLNDSMSNTLLLARHLLKSVTINRQFGDIPEITCAPSQINQVFLNLVTNAVQAMPGERGTLTLVSRREGDGVAVEIQDDGAGIPADILSKIFDPFFTTKEVGKGTGLGLSISYKIVQQHGGRIDVESEPGKGTKFTVWLPLVPPPEAKLED